MNTKSIKLSPKKGGHGHITSYTINIGSAEARECGFECDGEFPPLEKIIDPDHQQITIRVANEKED